MKKIFTFLFFAGLMTTAMAQNGRNAQHRDQSNGSSQSPVYSNNSQSNGGYQQPQQSGNGYQQNNGYSQNNGYAYGNDRRYDDRENDRRFRDYGHYDRRDYGYGRREYERNNRSRFNARISIRFGQPSCF